MLTPPSRHTAVHSGDALYPVRTSYSRLAPHGRTSQLITHQYRCLPRVSLRCLKAGKRSWTTPAAHTTGMWTRTRRRGSDQRSSQPAAVLPAVRDPRGAKCRSSCVRACADLRARIGVSPGRLRRPGAAAEQESNGREHLGQGAGGPLGATEGGRGLLDSTCAGAADAPRACPVHLANSAT